MTALRPLRRLPILAATLACLAATPSVSPASAAAAPTAATTCVTVPGVVSVGCPAVPGSQPCAGADLMPAAGNLGQVNKAILCLLNRERRKHGLKVLRRQSTLDAIATRFARQLVRQGFFDHTAPDGTTALDRVKATTYLRGPLRKWTVGENIAYGTGSLATPAEIMRSWMASPGHRANILHKAFREVGLGVSLGSPDGPDGVTYANDFGLRVR